MKRFLFRLTIFFLFVVVFFTAIISLYIVQFKSEVFRERIDVLFLGDSHFQNGVIPGKVTEHSHNLSLSGETYYDMANMLGFLLSNNVKIDVLAISLGPHNLDKKIDSLWVLNPNHFLTKFKSKFPASGPKRVFSFLKIINSDYSVYLNLIPEMMFQSVYSIERQILIGKFPYVGGYEKNQNVLRIDRIDSSVLVPSPRKQFQISNFQMYYLKEIISICQKNRIQLFYINTPVFVGEIVDFPLLADPEGYGVLLDYGNLYSGRNDLFADHVHLNEKGSVLFSDVLSKVFSKKIGLNPIPAPCDYNIAQNPYATLKPSDFMPSSTRVKLLDQWAKEVIAYHIWSLCQQSNQSSKSP